MTDYAYTSVSSISEINSELAKIQAALATKADIDQSNTMEADLDMNSNDILNVSSISTDSLLLNGQALQVNLTAIDVDAAYTWTNTHVFTNNVNFRAATNFGINDTTAGVIQLYGDGTGSVNGGEIRLFAAADYDTTIESYGIDVSQDDFRIFNSNGQVLFSVAGADNTTTILDDLQVGGDLNVSGAFTFTNGVYTNVANVFSESQTIRRGGATSALNLDATTVAPDVTNYYSRINFRVNDTNRWWVGRSSAAETGSNAGSNFGIWRFDDAGNSIDQPLTIDRASGLVTLKELQIGNVAAPASAIDTGITGEIRYDTTYLYICTATNTWRRIAHSTW